LFDHLRSNGTTVAGQGAAGQGNAAGDAAPPAEPMPEKHRPPLGRRLRIRSMVSVSGEVLPFFWPMRNFIHHNPLHGLEHLPFEQAVAEATRLFHARGWLPRTDYQQMLAAGDIDRDALAVEVDAFVADWLAQQGTGPGMVPGDGQANGEDGAADAELAALLRETLLAMLTTTSQPAPGDREPCAEEVLACLRRGGARDAGQD
jgi:hypothetical protein